VELQKHEVGRSIQPGYSPDILKREQLLSLSPVRSEIERDIRLERPLAGS
jgi:hypothetical protein